MLLAFFLHYLAPALVIVTSAYGVAIGQSKAIGGMIDALRRQPDASSDIVKTMFYGLFMIESCFALSVLVALMVLFSGHMEITLPMAVAEFSAVMAVGIASLFVGLAMGSAVVSGCNAISRQPLFVRKLQVFLVMVLTLIETPAIFSLVIAFLILNQINPQLEMLDGLRFTAAACAVGVGAIGPSIGQYIFSREACFSAGIKKESFNKVFTFSIVTEAFIETPVILCFFIGILIMLRNLNPVIPKDSGGFLFIVSALAVAVGTFGATLGIGHVGSKGIRQVALHPISHKIIFLLTLMSQVLVETSGIFAFVISFILLRKISF